MRIRKKRRRRAIAPILPLAALLACTLAFFLGRASMARARKASEAPWSNPWGTGTVQKKEAVPESEDSGEWKLCLVNASHPLTAEPDITLTELRNDQAIDSRAYPDLQEMVDAAREEGLDPLICSSYRTWNEQTLLYERKVSEYIDAGYSRSGAEQAAGEWVAVPGTSEHQLGLALDIVSAGYQHLDEEQENTAEQRWLLQNCWRYGFILRYPPSKSEITGIAYEPWHYRYVGRDAAREIFERGICLEEYLEEGKD